MSAIADNQAEAKVKSFGVGIGLSAGSSTPSANITSTTEAFSRGNVIGTTADTMARDVTVAATASDDATAGSEASGGGAVSVTSATVQVNALPTVKAGAGGTIKASRNVSITTESNSDADSTSSSSSGGAVAVTQLNATVVTRPNVTTAVDAGTLIAAGQTLTISASYGKTPPPLADGNFNAGSAVNTAANTINLDNPATTAHEQHGLLTGDTVVYSANNNTGIGGLIDGRRYSVIYASATELALGAAFKAGTTTVDVARDSISFANGHNLATGDRVVYHNAGSLNVDGLVEGQTYYVRAIDPLTIKLDTVDPATRVA
ncbi:MAG TPA: hypothetical protein VKJ07_08170, partial [Mycobacteriales bacterium]|nr:hypothetical protein [Mycobacteriales bacterium]